MNKKFFISIFSFALIFGLVATTYASHYVSPGNSVNDGEIRWGGSTKYLTQWYNAVSTWDSYGPIDIIHSSGSIDLLISDIYDDSEDFFGQYIHYFSSLIADTIELNKYYLDGDSSYGVFSSTEKQKVILHEIGHSLSLDDNNFIGPNVMNPGKLNYTTLGNQDKSDYNYLWGY